MEYYQPASRKHISREREKARKLRQSQWWKQRLGEGLCEYCGNTFAPGELTMDHRIPVARGGFSQKGNLAVSCKKCNSEKKHLTPAEQILNR